MIKDLPEEVMKDFNQKSQESDQWDVIYKMIEKNGAQYIYRYYTKSRFMQDFPQRD